MPGGPARAARTEGYSARPSGAYPSHPALAHRGRCRRIGGLPSGAAASASLPRVEPYPEAPWAARRAPNGVRGVRECLPGRPRPVGRRTGGIAGGAPGSGYGHVSVPPDGRLPATWAAVRRIPIGPVLGGSRTRPAYRRAIGGWSGRGEGRRRPGRAIPALPSRAAGVRCAYPYRKPFPVTPAC